MNVLSKIARIQPKEKFPEANGCSDYNAVIYNGVYIRELI